MYIVKVCLSLWNNRKHISKKFVKKRCKQFFIALAIFIVLLMIFLNVIRIMQKYYQFLPTSDYESEVGELSIEYLKALDELPFHDVTTNEEETIWSRLVYTELLYNRYLEWTKQPVSFDELRETYVDIIYNVNELPFIEIDELLKYVNMFYDSEILPFTDDNLNDINRELEREPSIKLYQNEFWLRAKVCSSNSSSLQFYCTGVAADNVFKTLCNEGKPSVKEAIFYSSMAVAFYLAAVKYYENNFDLILLYYRLAEIYIYLEEYIFFGEDNETYSKHFLLMAEVFLMLAETEYAKLAQNEDIHSHEKITYFGHYYSLILYKFIIEYQSKDEKLITMCRKYANQYLNSPYTGYYEGGCITCEDILIKLEKVSM